ncbi:hypothetical protein ACN08N_25540 (plasmid) [Photobacterium leiognathi subsp. mandapamensis]|uniref:hypothetical protein n=1 Tax=Photobacterium leiognathi TaxID=553611 RepID=UPI003AF3956F
MLTMNSEMSKSYKNLSLTNIELDHSLEEIVESGFKGLDGCLFLGKCLETDTNASISDFPDKTGYECFINSVNIDDYVDEGYLEQAVCFVRSVFSQWNEVQESKKLVAILSMDEFGVKVKFHVCRVGEEWLSDELEGYEESILVVDSSDSQFY